MLELVTKKKFLQLENFVWTDVIYDPIVQIAYGVGYAYLAVAMMVTLIISSNVEACFTYRDCFKGVNFDEPISPVWLWLAKVLFGSTFAYSASYFFSQAGLSASSYTPSNAFVVCLTPVTIIRRNEGIKRPERSESRGGGASWNSQSSYFLPQTPSCWLRSASCACLHEDWSIVHVAVVSKIIGRSIMDLGRSVGSQLEKAFSCWCGIWYMD
jgi:hypothetical protein